MKLNNISHLSPSLCGWALALAVLGLSSVNTSAVPYASGVSRNGNTVSFVLNHDAQGLVVLRDGANPVSPGTTAGVLSFDMTGYSSFQIIVTGNTAKAWTQYVPDGTDRNFEHPYGVSINKNAASPNFGKVYISNNRVGTTGANRACSDGIYMLRADGVDAGFATGGRTWTGDSAPYRSTIGPDNHLYVADRSGNLAWEFNEDLSAVTQLIDASNKTDSSGQVQQVDSIYVEGTQAAGNRKIYLVNGNYNDTSRKGLICYDLGANATATPGDTGTQIIGPSYYSYYPLDVARDSSGNWYLNQYRGTAGQAPAISKFDGSLPPPINSAIWATGNTYLYTWGLDLNEGAGRIAVGQDNSANNVYIFDTATGALVESFAAGPTAARPRELAYDAAGNMVTVDNITEYARFWSPGGNTVAITKSDGTFTLLTGGTVTVAATDAEAAEAGLDPAQFTLTRTQTGGDLTVYFTLGGTATSNVDYTVFPASPVTIPAGQATATITITPIDDSLREPTETVILTLQPHGGDYSLGSATSATATISDNDVALRYWDANGTVSGAGASPNGTWGTDNFWSTSADGTSATGPWSDWSMPVFSAGADAWSPFTVTVNGTQKVDGPLFEEGSPTLTGGALLLTNWSGIQVADTVTATINSVITGSSGLTKDLPGTLVLGGANTYSGATVVKAGTLKLGATDTLPRADVSVAGTLDLGGFNQTVNGFSGAGTVDSSGYAGIANILTVGNNDASSSFAGSIKNSGGDKVGLTKVGTGTFTLAGTHSFSGDTTLSAGTLAIDGSTFFGDETGALKLSGGNILMTASHTASGTSFANSLEMTADTTFKCAPGISGTWYMRFSSGLLSFNGGTFTITNQGASSTTFNVQFQTMGGVAFARPIYLGNGTQLELCNDDTVNPAVLSGPVTGGGKVNYTCWNDGTGGYTLATNGNNTYSGGSILTGGFIALGANSTGNPVTAGPIGTGTLTINNDPNLGLLAWGGPRTIANPISFNVLNDANALHLTGTNDLTFTGAVNLGYSNRTFLVDNTGVTTFAGVISGGGAGKELTKSGPGTLVFSGNNTYTLPMTVMEGTLLVNNTAGSGTGSGALTFGSGTRLGGTGTIAGAVNASTAIVAPGASAGGRLTFQAGLDLSYGTEEWELAANSVSNPGTDFDQIALTGGNLSLYANTTLKLAFIGTATVPDLSNPFWQYPRQWRVIALSGTAANPGNSNFSLLEGTNGITAGTFSTIADAGGVTLVYTPSVSIPPKPVTQMSLTAPAGGACTLNYSGGAGSQFVLVRSPEVGAPLSGWTRVATNSSLSGSFTVPVGADPKQFYRIISE